MSMQSDPLWREYGEIFRSLDDFSLARWMSQTLGQFRGRVVRLSHPLMVAYRLANDQAFERDVWPRRLVPAPHGYHPSPCCSAPFLPRIHYDVAESGLLCEHCWEILVPFGDLPADFQPLLRDWGERYDRKHQVAHWTDEEMARFEGDFSQHRAESVSEALGLLSGLRGEILPGLLDHYPALVWDDQDECLEIGPEDIR